MGGGEDDDEGEAAIKEDEARKVRRSESMLLLLKNYLQMANWAAAGKLSPNCKTFFVLRTVLLCLPLVADN